MVPCASFSAKELIQQLCFQGARNLPREITNVAVGIFLCDYTKCEIIWIHIVYLFYIPTLCSMYMLRRILELLIPCIYGCA